MSAGISKFKSWVAKVKTIKHIEVIIVIAVCIIAVLIYLGVSKGIKSSDTVFKPYDEVNVSSGDDKADRLTEILSSMSGVGSCKVMLTYGDNDVVEGVVIVAEGADNTQTKLRIIDAVSALLKVDSGCVKIYKMQ
ncbi:MAG: hypothetical protein K2M44_01685 [Clostridia bacterium]|nr:hypothetical protein [Clostridia bacterium]